MSRSHGKRKLAVAQEQFISAAQWMRSQRRNATFHMGKSLSIHLCWSRNKVCSMQARAPAGQHTLWAYCHVPFDCNVDVSDRIESQIERFAPGFRDCILARHKMRAADLGKSNSNLAGGDISGGATNLMQLVARPVLSPTPYRTPIKGVYLCSSSTPPGGGVHGMCGYHAARTALREIFGKR